MITASLHHLPHGWLPGQCGLDHRNRNERVDLPFPCLIGKLCLQANIPPNKLVDRWDEAYKLTASTLHTLIEVRNRVNQHSHLHGHHHHQFRPYRLEVVQRDVLAAEKWLKDEMQTELAVLKDRMDGFEVHVQHQLEVVGPVNAEVLKTQLVEMRVEIAKLAEKPFSVPPLVVSESLMSLFTGPLPLKALMTSGETSQK
ncbi:hypothetical protein KY285_020135 [Solanum tuberosum]|nr:hypothetical protein KY285_020135 [Solanum tuberosum]